MSVYYAILDAVLDSVKSIDLTDIDDTNIQLVKALNERETVVPGLPGVLIAPLGPESMVATDGTNEREDIGYPVVIILLDQDRQQSGTGLPADAEEGTQDQTFRYNQKLLWRSQVRKQFINQRLSLSGVTPPQTNRCTVEPLAVVNATEWLETNLWISGMVFRFWTREVRG